MDWWLGAAAAADYYYLKSTVSSASANGGTTSSSCSPTFPTIMSPHFSSSSVDDILQLPTNMTNLCMLASLQNQLVQYLASTAYHQQPPPPPLLPQHLTVSKSPKIQPVGCERRKLPLPTKRIQPPPPSAVRSIELLTTSPSKADNGGRFVACEPAETAKLTNRFSINSLLMNNDKLSSSINVADTTTSSSSSPASSTTNFKYDVTIGYTIDALHSSDGRCKRNKTDEMVVAAASSKDEQKYVCSQCAKSYATSSNLSRHKQTHRPLDSVHAKRCPHCDKAYVSMPALSMHILTHKAAHKCSTCGKSFSRPWLLQGHMRSHSGLKPFGCAHCGKAFADRSNLRAHMQTHTGAKKHQCQHCGKSFALKSYLNKHIESVCPSAGINASLTIKHDLPFTSATTDECC